MTFVGIFGILLGLLSSTWAFVRPNRTRFVVFLALYGFHIAMSYLFYTLVVGTTVDAALYYYDWADAYNNEGFGFNTLFIVYITQAVKSVFGGTFLDFFMLFQAIGFFGVAFLMRTFEEIYESVEIPQPAYAFLILFLPSVSYWTSAIGKDGIFFLATTLCIWAVMRLKQRIVPLLIGLALLLCVRPHIVLITVAALGLAFVRERSFHPALRGGLFLAAVAGAVFAVASVRSTFQIDVANVNIVSDVLSAREAILQSDAAGRTAVTGSYPVRVFSLLFRPFFYDAGNVLGLIVSVENLILVVILGTFVVQRRTLTELMRSVLYVRFAMISWVAILLLLAVGYYNVGLGIRQKATMVLPGILVIYVTLMAVLARQRLSAPVVQPPLVETPLRRPAVGTLRS